jgi:hypothetical protein
MKIYNDYMHDLWVILFYELYNIIKPFLINIITTILYLIIICFKKYYYIPFKKDLNLKKVIIVINSNIVFSNTINLNYYHLKINLNDKYIDIRGNKKYILYNHYIFSNIQNNIFDFKIHELPIKLYAQEECCICYNNMGSLNGLCGHQNICSECASRLTKCPMCNTKLIKNCNLIEKILYI